MAEWRPEHHPRDWRGRFITTGARVRLQGGLMGRVTGIQPARRADLPAAVTVQSDDGRTGTVPSDRITIALPPVGYAFISDGTLATVGDEVRHTDAPGSSVIKRVNPDGSVVVGSRIGGDTTDRTVTPESLTRTENMRADQERDIAQMVDDFTPEPGQVPAAPQTATPRRTGPLRVTRPALGQVLQRAGIHPATSSPTSVRGWPRTTPGYKISRGSEDGTLVVEYDYGVGVGARRSAQADPGARQRQVTEALRTAGYDVEEVENNGRPVQTIVRAPSAPAPAAPTPAPAAPTAPVAPDAEVTPEGVRNRYDLRAIRERANPQEQRALARAERARESAARAAENARYARSSRGSRVQSPAEVRANGRIRDAETEVARVENGIYDRLVQEETARRGAPAAPAAPTPAPPTPDAPTNPDNPTPTGPTAADGLPLAVDDRITVNGRTGTIRSIRPGTGIAIYVDEEGRQRSSRIGNFTHLNEAPPETAPANAPAAPTPDAPAPEVADPRRRATDADVPGTGTRARGLLIEPERQRESPPVPGMPEGSRLDNTNIDFENLETDVILPDGTRVRVRYNPATSTYSPADGSNVPTPQDRARDAVTRANEARGNAERANTAEAWRTSAAAHDEAAQAVVDAGESEDHPVVQQMRQRAQMSRDSADRFDAQAAPPPSAPAATETPAAPTAPAAPTGPVAADGRPLARDERITVNGRTGTVTSVRANAGIVVYRDDEGRQRSAQIARVNHVDEAPVATTNEPAAAAPDTPTSAVGIGDPLPDAAEIDYETLDIPNMQAEATLPDGRRVRFQAAEREGAPRRIIAILDPDAPASEPEPTPAPVAANAGFPDIRGLGAQLATVIDARPLRTRLAREIEAVYNGDTGLGKNGARVQVTSVTGTPSRMSFSMNIVDADGNRIGNVSRSIKYSRVDANVPIEVHNDLMMVNRNVQGQGIASDLYARQEEWFATQGVPKVTIHANIDVGGFAWARKGYDYDGRQSALSHLNMVLSRATANNHKPEITSQIRNWIKQINESPSGQRSWPTPYEVSQLGYVPGAEIWPGKRLMLGTDWYAVKRLRRRTA